MVLHQFPKNFDWWFSFQLYFWFLKCIFHNSMSYILNAKSNQYFKFFFAQKFSHAFLWQTAIGLPLFLSALTALQLRITATFIAVASTSLPLWPWVPSYTLFFHHPSFIFLSIIFPYCVRLWSSRRRFELIFNLKTFFSNKPNSCSRFAFICFASRFFAVVCW